MVPKKAKSKRGTARQRYKIQKKIKEHGRKVRKEMKKFPEKFHKSKKDPGIPKMFPFREQILKQVEESKTKIQEEKLQLRQRQIQKIGVERAEAKSLADLKRDAEKRSRDFSHETSDGTVSTNGSSLHLHDASKRAYYREFKKVLEASDVILEILDARDPAGCRCPQIEQMIMGASANKKIILVLNKIDLVPRDVVEKWLKHLRHEFPTVAFKASTQEQRQKLGQSKSVTTASPRGSDCLGADTLMQLLKNYCRNLNIKTAITVGVIGYPNVGKSSLINSLKRARACQVGAMPGVTKSMQEIQLDTHIRLLDCPGIVFRVDQGDSHVQGDLLLRNCLRIDQLDDPIAAVEAVLHRCRREDLMMLYKIPIYETTMEFLLLLAKLKGKLKKGGAPDLEATAKILLQEWNNGKIAFHTMPPVRDVRVGDSVVVEQWSKEFDLGTIQPLETTMLSGLKEKVQSGLLLTPSEPLPLPFDTMEAADRDHESFEDADKIVEKENAMEIEKPAVASSMRSLVIQTRVAKKTSTLPRSLMTPEEDALNPRINQQRKKQMKQEKKQQRRAANDDNRAMSLDPSADAFDFETDFVPASTYEDDIMMAAKVE